MTSLKLDTDTLTLLSKKAKQIRINTFKAIFEAGGGHFGGSLSISEILAVLYFHVLNIDPLNPDAPERDRFILSKGHAGPALYTTLALRGYFPVEELKNLDKPLSKFPKHIDRLKLKGIEASTGPLGQGLSIGCGIAISLRQKKEKNRVYVLMGDGECNSGQVWEAVMTGAKYGLANLTVFVDRNNCQIDGTCGDIMPMGPLNEKFKAFGWNVLAADGHDVEDLLKAVSDAESCQGKPSIIITETIKGRGVSFMEGEFGWHSGQVSPEQFKSALEELGGEAAL